MRSESPAQSASATLRACFAGNRVPPPAEPIVKQTAVTLIELASTPVRTQTRDLLPANDLVANDVVWMWNSRELLAQPLLRKAANRRARPLVAEILQMKLSEEKILALDF